jgi:hypothetical protein
MEVGTMSRSQRPVFPVNFNEMVDEYTVLLSVDDELSDTDGKSVVLSVGLEITVFEKEDDEFFLVAHGTAETNNANDWSSHVKWCCRIDTNGIQNAESLATVLGHQPK